MVTGYRDSQALYVVAKLGVADLLVDGPKTAEGLARRLGVQARPLFRVMRALAGEGVFTQDGTQGFGLAPLGEPLRSDHPRSVRSSAIMHGELHYRAAGALLHTVRTGETGFDHLYGKGLFAHLGEHPEDSATFNAAMGETQGVWSNPIESYDFRGHHVLVDVGGGRGTLLALLLKRNPHLRGILYDLPQGVAEARSYLESQRVSNRCQIRIGDAFREVPRGGDVYIFSRVLHDWPDDKARSLLANVRTAIPDDGLLLLWEAVVPEGATPSLTKHIDLTMLFLLGGAERTEAEWRAMLAATGFALLKVTKTGGMFDLIEAKPV
ncbi:MAG TPA: methyltransferase [Thermoplasmata archaeon]|nr:methyltransferase [Thermoplasmata archaeon]